MEHIDKLEQQIESEDNNIEIDGDYRPITFKKEDFLYKITDRDIVFGETTIYDPTPIYTTKKRFWRKPITTCTYKKLFVIDENIESTRFNKKDIKRLFGEGYDKYQRFLEIEKGEVL